MATKKENKSVKNYTVVQANDLIRNKKDFSLWELRVFALLTAHVKKEDDDFQTYRFRIKDLLDLFETKSNNLYDELKNIPEKLHAKIIKIPYEDKKGKKRVRRYNLISMSDFPDEEKIDDGEYIELRFDKDLKPLMLNLGKHFTVYKFYNILKLRSPYIFQLYELLKSEEYKGGDSIDISLQEFVDILQIPKSYKYGNIRQRILDPAQIQFADFTDITFQYEPIKGRGGRIVKLRFRIFKNEKPELIEAEKPQAVIPKKEILTGAMAELFPRVEKWMDKTSLQRLLDSYPEAQVRKSINYTLNRIEKGDIIQNVAGYIVAMSKQTNLFDSVEEERKQQVQKSQRKDERARRKQDLEQQKEKLITELGKKENAIIQALFLEKPELEEEIFLLTQSNRFAHYDSSKNLQGNLEDPIFKAAFNNTIKKQFKSRFSALEKFYKPKLKSLDAALHLL